MIISMPGDLLSSDADALVNTVNCVGVMGKGVALRFKHKFPAMFNDYVQACTVGKIQPGAVHVFQRGLTGRYVISFPTKRHWRSSSRMEDIDAGLVHLALVVRSLHLASIAIPPLGCGNGGLSWRDVRPLIVRAFEPLPDVRVELYEESVGGVPS